MPLFALRRTFAFALVAALAILAPACKRQNDGAMTIGVIGANPKIVDPAAGPLSPGDSLLLANVAQGLVRFDARGQIEPGLAERWNVSNDGLSYIFRIASAEWPSGGKISAHQVARMLRRQLAAGSNNSLKDTLGAIDEIVGMTDRVLEIRLRAPRPHLLQLLAQPEFALVRNGEGTGPFKIAAKPGPDGELRLTRRVAGLDGDEGRREEVWVEGTEASAGVRAFASGQLDLLLGGRFNELPLARAVKLPRGALVFDPVAGLFGLAPARGSRALENPEIRRLLVQAIDRDTLLAALNVPGLVGRATLLEAGFEGFPDPVTPAWMATPIGDRRQDLIAAADRVFESLDRPTLRIALPDGPGATILFNRLSLDWALLGIKVERVALGRPADLRLVDAVSPSNTPAWFLRQFRCDQAPICDEEADKLLDAARTAPIAAQRVALLSEAARRMDDAQLFLPITAPIRWSLVSARIEGFAGNRFARHTLTALDQKLTREGVE